MDEIVTSSESRAFADALPYILWTHDSEGGAGYFNRVWTEYTGKDLATTVQDGPASFVHPSERDEVMRLFAAARESGRAFEARYRLRRHDGAYRWHLARVAPLRHDGSRVIEWLGTALDVDEQRRSEVERAYLADAGRILGSTLDLRQTLTDVARMVVPELADWCAINLLGRDGQLERATVAHVNPAKVALAWQLWAQAPPRPEDPHGAYAVIRTGQVESFEVITDEVLVASSRDAEALATLRALGLQSSMCVPLLGRAAPLGAVSLVAAESGRHYAARDIAFAEEVARRIATAVENAQLYEAAEEARRAAEAIAADVVQQSADVERALGEMRSQRDAALARAAAGASPST